MPPLTFYAGSSALQYIKEYGLTSDSFSAFMGASGGPKWFVLAGLDKVIFNEFLDTSNDHIDILGSSAGAFRACCFAQRDPRAAITRLADSYSNMIYSDKPTVDEITNKGLALLYQMMGEFGVDEVLECDKKTVHIFIARCHGLTAYDSRAKQLAGLAIAAGRNAINRKNLSKSFSRLIMSSTKNRLKFKEKNPYVTEFGLLNRENFLQSLMASGSIPAVIKGVKNIPDVPPGMFRDGGIIDYHFDIQIQTPKLVLYPHFYPTVTPGWFDKSIKSRQCDVASYDNVLLVAPSDEFVASLPYSKIPDRKDFETMEAEQRIKYWHKVIAESDRLAECFLNTIKSENVINFIKPINLKR